MSRDSIITYFKIAGVALLVYSVLFAAALEQSSSALVGSTLKEVASIFNNKETQSVVFAFFIMYIMAFVMLRFHRLCFGSVGNADLWLICVVLICGIRYIIDRVRSGPALVLLGGVVLGQGAAVWGGTEFSSRKLAMNANYLIVLGSQAICLILASVWHADLGQHFEYHGQVRWSGPWENPNAFGVLMGTGLALVLGIMGEVWRKAKRKFVLIALWLLVTCLMGNGLICSYSRGAWLGTICGLGYLVIRRFATPLRQCVGNKAIVFLSMIAGVCVLALWHFSHTDTRSARRVFSMFNGEDFSLRNRAAAWEGALQITTEHPWFGVGWNQAEPLYERYYLPSALNESMAVEMNDYLMLGATLGIPALFCFGMYCWLSLQESAECRAQNSKGAISKDTQDLERSWLRTTCRAGAIVLLVGFWFDGGLFKLPTAATFWILLGLGSANLAKGTASAIGK